MRAPKPKKTALNKILILAGLIIAVLVCLPIIFVGLGIITAKSYQAKDRVFEQKVINFLDGRKRVQTSTKEFYGLGDGEFVCLISSWGEQGKMPKHGDYTALERAGLSKDDIPAYFDFPYNMYLWEYFDDWGFTLTAKKKITSVHRLWQGGSNSLNSAYGCYDGTAQMTIGIRPRSGFEIELPTFNRDYEEKIAALLGSQNTALTTVSDLYDLTGVAHVCIGHPSTYGIGFMELKAAAKQAITQATLPNRMAFGSSWIIAFAADNTLVLTQEIDTDLLEKYVSGCFGPDLELQFTKINEAYQLSFPNLPGKNK